MNDSTEPLAARERPVPDAATRFPSDIYASIYLPKGIYEALPLGYISLGTLFILGAAYIGIGHRPMIGYLAVGLSCILAGVAVSSIRHRQRSKSEKAF